MEKKYIEEISNRIQIDKDLDIKSVNPVLSRYMPLETLWICLENNSLRFSKPKTWNNDYDVFEDLLSSVCYIKENYNNKPIPYFADSLTQNYYAQCWNIGYECEGMWKSHTKGLDNGVMIKLKLENIIKLIVKSFSKEIEDSTDIQFIKVEYRNIRDIVNSADKYFQDVFDNGINADKYVDFFKLKRKEFIYENEYRFLIHLRKNTDVRKNDKYISNFIEYIDEIIFSPKFDDVYYKCCKNELISKYKIPEEKISKSKLFDLDYYIKDTILSRI